MENDFPLINYYWNENNVDIIIENSDQDDEVKIRQIESFVSKMGIEFFKIGTIRKMYKVGLNSIEKIILLDSIDIFLKAEGIKFELQIRY